MIRDSRSSKSVAELLIVLQFSCASAPKRYAEAMARIVAGRYQCDRSTRTTGPFGTTYHARDLTSGAAVMVTALRQSLSTDPVAVAGLMSARADEKIDHPNVLRILDSGVGDDGRPFWVSEVFDGKTLGSLVHERGALPEELVLEIARQMFAALDAAHSHDLLHGELNPGAVLVRLSDERCVVKVRDFGVAATLDNRFVVAPGDASISEYFAPELFLDDFGRAHPRVDVYAAGQILFRALTGVSAFDQATPEAIEGVLRADRLPRVSDFRPTVSEETDDSIARAMKVSAQDRFQTIADFRDALVARRAGADSFSTGFLLSNRYRIDARIAINRVAAVYRAFDENTRELCVVKILRKPSRDEETVLQARLRQEVDLGKLLKHACIVRTSNFGVWKGHAFLVREYVTGSTLREASKTMSWPTYCALLATLADALTFIHKLEIVHRDFNPDNILVDQAGRPRLIDFGLARAPESILTGSLIGGLGRVGYIAPEQARDPANVTAAADQWSFAAIIYEALTGRHPLSLSELAESTAPKSVRVYNRTVPRDLDAVIARALSHNPEERFPSIGEFVGALVAESSQRIKLK